MKFSIVVAISMYCLIFSSIEVKAQTVKNNRDKSYVEEDKLIGKRTSSWSDLDSIAKKQDHNQLKVVVKCEPSLVKCGTNGTVAEGKSVINNITKKNENDIIDKPTPNGK